MSLAVLLAALTCTTDPYATVIKHTTLCTDVDPVLQITYSTWKSVPTVPRIKIHLLSSKQAKRDIRRIRFTITATRIPQQKPETNRAVINDDTIMDMRFSLTNILLSSFLTLSYNVTEILSRFLHSEKTILNYFESYSDNATCFIQ